MLHLQVPNQTLRHWKVLATCRGLMQKWYVQTEVPCVCGERRIVCLREENVFQARSELNSWYLVCCQLKPGSCGVLPAWADEHHQVCVAVPASCVWLPVRMLHGSFMG